MRKAYGSHDLTQTPRNKPAVEYLSLESEPADTSLHAWRVPTDFVNRYLAKFRFARSIRRLG